MMSVEIAEILRKVTLLVLAGALVQTPVLALRFALRKAGSRTGNLAFSMLLGAFSLNLVYHLFILLGVFQRHPELLYLPVYCTLAFGPLLFFYVKLTLFPAYRLRWTDAKHILLPLGQVVYFLALFMLPVELKSQIKRSLVSPFYGGVEMILYVTTFYAYLYFAWRFVIYRRKQLRHHPYSPAMREVRLLNQYLWGMLVLYFFNSAYIATDFISYDLLTINLHALPGFTRLGELSFATLVWWSCFHGWRVWLIDRIVAARKKRAATSSARPAPTRVRL
ncbi:MAG: hypothetical protein D6818_11065, partial [Bacteroidetes bacterium]